MWITSEVNLPQKVIDDHENGELVLFIGAGASMGAPSSLPSFEALAKELARLAGEPFNSKVGLDYFLGSLPDGFDVHRHTRDLIEREESKPNSTHAALMRIALSRDQPRLVTTNFDRHLSTVSKNDELDIWAGPAVPLGHDFTGIVHLHGSTERNSRYLVLTDRDFGRAYLTDAWATRFLLQLFQKFTVLFVGYSHEDPIMRYLALGLPSRTSRYAFMGVKEQDGTNTDADKERNKWSSLGIETIEYPVHGNDHKALVAALEAWDLRVRMGGTDHSAMTAEIIAGGTQITPVDHDYLLSRLSTEEGAHEFVKHVETVEPVLQAQWLRWIEDFPSFKGIFSSGLRGSIPSILGRWFCWSFIAKPELHGAALQTVQRLGQKFDAAFIEMACMAANELYKQDKFAGRRWKSFLASSVSRTGASALEFGLLPYEPHDEEEAGAVLRAAIEPYLLLKPRITFDETQDLMQLPDAVVHWEAHSRTLARHVSKAVASRKPGDWALGNLLEMALQSAYELLDTYHGDRNWDPLTFGRMAIEPHEQDQYRKPIDAIIDGLRDYGEKALPANSTLIDTWWSTDLTLFRRLSIHLLRLNQAVSVDEKISWLLERSVLFETELKHEVYLALKSSVGESSETSRKNLLAATRIGPVRDEEIPDHERRNAYAVFNLVSWLFRSDPGWTEAREVLDELKSGNPEFLEREHPDMNRWMTGGTWAGKLPMEVDEFISKFRSEPLQTVEDLLSQDYSRENVEEPEWSDCLSLVRQVAESQPDIGYEFWSLITSNPDVSHSKNELFISIVEGWAMAMKEDVGVAMLERVASLTSSKVAARAVSRFLLEQIQKRIDEDDSEFLGKMRHLAIDLFAKQSDGYRHSGQSAKNSIAVLELNSWPGDLAHYWISEVDRRWRKHREEWVGLDDEERAAIKRLIGDPEHVCDAAGPAFAGNLYFMHAADSQFTVDHILPLFEDERFRRASWRAYLHNPRIDNQLLAAGFTDRLITAWGLIHELEVHLQGQFFSLVISLISYSSISEEQREKLLEQSILAENGKYASSFVQTIGTFLEDAGVDRTEVWKRWLRDYMSRRLRGIPRDAGTDEVSSWGYLIPYLGDGVPEAIEMYEPHEVGFDTRHCRWDFPDAVISEYGSDLVGHYAHRIRHTRRDIYGITHDLDELLAALKRTLDDNQIQPIIEARESIGL